jgi:hypothetical protein
MDAQEHLFYGFGHVVYAVAMADGKVQTEEHRAIHEIVEKRIKDLCPDFSVSDIIFQLLEKEHFSRDTAYDYGIRFMKLGDYYLTRAIRDAFVDTVEAVAAAYPPSVNEERRLINEFKEDLRTMHMKNEV